MSEELIIKYCAPTLAGIKTANLFSSACASRSQLYSGIRILNSRLVSKGVRILPLKCSGGRALIYIYRMSKLKNDLSKIQASSFLKSIGYKSEKPELCIVRLISRLNESGEFPHEIGFFLGYPYEDVIGFIKNKSAYSKCTGCWKVYGDVEKAMKTFELYKSCTDIYYKQWKSGKTVEQLTVAG